MSDKIIETIQKITNLMQLATITINELGGYYKATKFVKTLPQDELVEYLAIALHNEDFMPRFLKQAAKYKPESKKSLRAFVAH